MCSLVGLKWGYPHCARSLGSTLGMMDSRCSRLFATLNLGYSRRIGVCVGTASADCWNRRIELPARVRLGFGFLAAVRALLRPGKALLNILLATASSYRTALYSSKPLNRVAMPITSHYFRTLESRSSSSPTEPAQPLLANSSGFPSVRPSHSSRHNSRRCRRKSCKFPILVLSYHLVMPLPEPP